LLCWGANNVGNKSGFVGQMKTEGPHSAVTNCIQNQHVLVSKTLLKIFSNIMHTIVYVTNFIQSCAANQCRFKIPCQKLGSEYDVQL
jgi:hypothetical protein